MSVTAADINNRGKAKRSVSVKRGRRRFLTSYPIPLNPAGAIKNPALQGSFKLLKDISMLTTCYRKVSEDDQ